MRYIIVFLFLINIGAAAGPVLRAQGSPLTDHLLKVRAAEAAGLDTLAAFKAMLEDCRRGLIRAELTDEAVMEQATRRRYEQLKANGRLRQVRVRQIYLPLAQNATKRTVQQAQDRMDSIHTILQKDTTAERFSAVVDLFSAIKEARSYRPLQMTAEMEAVADTLKVGRCSRPFFTPQGLHILRLEERKEPLSYEQVRSELMQKLSRTHRTDAGMQAKIKEWKKQYRFEADKAAVDELLSKGSTRRVLFTIEKRAYNGEQFARFAQSHPYGVRRNWEAFVTKSLLDYANEHLGRVNLTFSETMRTFRDSLLIAAITKREIEDKYPLTEEVLKTYFEEHRKQYRWEPFRYRGIVLHAANKRTGKQARKLLKGLPEAEWENALRLMVNIDGKVLIRFEQGQFQPGDNAYIDHKFFRKKHEPTADVSYPFTYFLGKKVKGPKGFEEVREAVASDYRRSLEEAWLERLRKDSKVEIDQEVLKTVNGQ